MNPQGDAAPYSAGLTRRAVLIIAAIAVLWAVRWLKPVLVPLVLGIFITFWLTPLVDWLERWRVRRSIGAALVLLILVSGVGVSGYALRDDATSLMNGLPDAARHAQGIFNEALSDRTGWLHHLRTALNQVSTAPGTSVAPPAEAIAGGSVDMQGALIHWSRAAVAAVVNFGLVLFLVYFLLAAGDLFKRRLLTVMSGGISRRRVTVTMLEQIGQQLQRYLVVLVVTNMAIGVLTGLAFAALGVEHAAVWGVATAIIHVVPYAGSAVIAGASGLIAAVQFESVAQGLAVAGVSLLISTLVGMLLTTWLASRASAMNSAAVFVGLLFWGWLWGISRMRAWKRRCSREGDERLHSGRSANPGMATGVATSGRVGVGGLG
ncbi:MAG: AI-2E family transporter [Steroidobacterales bacterium]